MFYKRESILCRGSLESAKNRRILKSGGRYAMQSQAITLHSIGIQSSQPRKECRSPSLAIRAPRRGNFFLPESLAQPMETPHLPGFAMAV
jgi:hypothetical protein